MKIYELLNKPGSKSATLEELKRDMTTTEGGAAGHFKLDVYNKIIPENSLAEILGINVVTDFKNNLEIPYTEDFYKAVEILAEEGQYSGTTLNRTKSSLIKNRFVFKMEVTDEYLKSQVVDDLIFNDALKGIETKAVEELLNNMLTDTTSVSGSSSTDYNDLLSNFNSVNAVSPWIIVNKDNFIDFSGLTSDNIFVADGHLKGKYLGTNVLGTDLFTDDKSFLADFGRSFIVWFSDLEVIVNPFIKSNEGIIELTFVRYGDVSFNPYMVQLIG